MGIVAGALGRYRRLAAPPTRSTTTTTCSARRFHARQVVLVLLLCISRIDALTIVDSGLRGEHGWSSRGDRVLLLSSECCRGRVFRKGKRRRGSRRRLGERGGGRHHESREEECVHEREARFGAPVTRHGARGRVRRVGEWGVRVSVLLT